MAWTPCGTKHQHAVASLVLALETDVPAGAVLVVSASAAGHANYPIMAVGSTLGALSGGDTGFFAGSNQVSREFAVDCPDGVSAGETITITMTGAGQGVTTIMWASAVFVPDATVADLGLFG